MISEHKRHYLQAGFNLAYYILPDRPAALAIAVAALRSWEKTCFSQDKRLYKRAKSRLLTLLGRAPLNRIQLSDEQVLQLLIYQKVEEHKAVVCQDEEGRLIYYLMQVIKQVLRLNSFYAAVLNYGLLYDYQRIEVENIYSVVNPQRAENKRSDHFDRARQTLREKLQTKVGHWLVYPLINTLDPNQIARVQQTLRQFGLWGTGGQPLTNPLPANFNRYNLEIPGLINPNAGNEDLCEQKRLQVLLHPDHHRRLIAALGYAAPEKKILLPVFDQNLRRDGDDMGERDKVPPLTDDELQTALQQLDAENSDVAGVNISSLAIMIDGQEVQIINLAQTDTATVLITDDACLLEIWGNYVLPGGASKHKLLASHIFTYRLLHSEQFKIPLPQRHSLVVQFTPLNDQNLVPRNAPLVGERDPDPELTDATPIELLVKYCRPWKLWPNWVYVCYSLVLFRLSGFATPPRLIATAASLMLLIAASWGLIFRYLPISTPVVSSPPQVLDFDPRAANFPTADPTTTNPRSTPPLSNPATDKAANPLPLPKITGIKSKVKRDATLPQHNQLAAKPPRPLTNFSPDTTDTDTEIKMGVTSSDAELTNLSDNSTSAVGENVVPTDRYPSLGAGKFIPFSEFSLALRRSTSAEQIINQRQLAQRYYESLQAKSSSDPTTADLSTIVRPDKVTTIILPYLAEKTRGTTANTRPLTTYPASSNDSDEFNALKQKNIKVSMNGSLFLLKLALPPKFMPAQQVTYRIELVNAESGEVISSNLVTFQPDKVLGMIATAIYPTYQVSSGYYRVELQELVATEDGEVLNTLYNCFLIVKGKK